MSIDDRRRGCFYGLAVGDALGAIVEYQRPGSFAPVTDFRAGGPHGLSPGEWTDETSMMVALATSIVRSGWDPHDQARQYLAWWQEGQYSVRESCIDINHVMASSLDVFARTNDLNAMRAVAAHSTNNASASRLAPVVLAFLDESLDYGRVSELAAQSSLVTHAHAECVSVCRYLAIVLAGLIAGNPRETVLSSEWEPLLQLRRQHPLHRNVELVAAGSFRVLRPPEIQASGYSAKCLEAALWAFHDASTFGEAVLRAVNLGHDADNAGAICGQIAGAAFGATSIPSPWLENLGRKDLVDRTLDSLLEFSRSS